ncbi:MAG: endolytic transglycosylase MltG [Magnetococcus sp. DMHC-8]
MTSSSPAPDPSVGGEQPPAEPEPDAVGEVEEVPPAPQRGRRWRVWAGLLLLLGGLAGWGGWDFWQFLHRPLPAAVLLEIERGWPLARIAELLEQRGVVSSAHWFMLLARWDRVRISRDGLDLGPGIQAGEYECAVGETPAHILARLTEGRQVVHRLVIPEGLTVAEIGARMRAQGWETAESLLAEPDITRKLGLEVPLLEGWLFPSTYHYRRHDTALEMLTRMVRQAQQVMHDSWQAARQAGVVGPSRPAHMAPLSPAEVLILASIIEKETGRAEERTRVSAVFHNRLRKKMRLQSDPTVIYGVQHAPGGAGFGGDLTRQHLRTPTPYNTYTQPGLPPAPICNPGKAAIQAALHPAEVDDLYFVARGEGYHVFAKTLAEHEANVDRYQRHVVPAKR